MDPTGFFAKSAPGQAEIESGSMALSLHERCVPILVNGDKDLATLTKLSLADIAANILESLLAPDLVEPAVPATHQKTGEEKKSADQIGARDFSATRSIPGTAGYAFANGSGKLWPPTISAASGI